ncbi:hypothetical protein LFZ48_16805 [Salmonella enterica subsp. salamae serovar 56:z10:e,n,x str. 1369-73]|nr:hypothetical protein LFZ48_16805 [Salmonella enterica subsp. salamae serovar 56:z10:e,n,x str. 1369-73]
MSIAKIAINENTDNSFFFYYSSIDNIIKIRVFLRIDNGNLMFTKSIWIAFKPLKNERRLVI